MFSPFQYECKDFQEALNVLDLVETNSLKPVARNISFSINQCLSETEQVNKNVSSYEMGLVNRYPDNVAWEP